MDLTEPRSGHLAIEGGLPGWLGLFLLMPAFVAVVLAMMWQPMTLTCDRGGDCTLESAGLFGGDAERFRAAGLRRAEVESSRASRGGATYRVMLATDAGAKPLTPISTSDRAEVEREARRINAFVSGEGGARLVVARDETGLLVAAVVMAALAALLTYFIPRRYRTVIDGGEREVRHQAAWLGMGRERRVAFDEVTGVDLRPFLWINGRRWWRAILRTSGRPVVLGYGPGGGELDDQVAEIRARF